MMNKWLALVGFLVLCLGVGAGAGFMTAESVVTWFPTLNKPFFNPPPWVFAPVWTTLYIMMALAAWRVLLSGAISKPALNLFFGQLVLNFLWSLLFFGLHSPALALVDIIALWIMIALTLRAFLKIARPSGYLLMPYLAWVSFATLLNASIWWLN
jgi:benzodiazapine receptor